MSLQLIYSKILITAILLIVCNAQYPTTTLRTTTVDLDNSFTPISVLNSTDDDYYFMSVVELRSSSINITTCITLQRMSDRKNITQLNDCWPLGVTSSYDPSIDSISSFSGEGAGRLLYCTFTSSDTIHCIHIFHLLIENFGGSRQFVYSTDLSISTNSYNNTFLYSSSSWKNSDFLFRQLMDFEVFEDNTTCIIVDVNYVNDTVLHLRRIERDVITNERIILRNVSITSPKIVLNGQSLVMGWLEGDQLFIKTLDTNFNDIGSIINPINNTKGDRLDLKFLSHFFFTQIENKEQLVVSLTNPIIQSPQIIAEVLPTSIKATIHMFNYTVDNIQEYYNIELVDIDIGNLYIHGFGPYSIHPEGDMCVLGYAFGGLTPRGYEPFYLVIKGRDEVELLYVSEGITDGGIFAVGMPGDIIIESINSLWVTFTNQFLSSDALPYVQHWQLDILPPVPPTERPQNNQIQEDVRNILPIFFGVAIPVIIIIAIITVVIVIKTKKRYNIEATVYDNTSLETKEEAIRSVCDKYEKDNGNDALKRWKIDSSEVLIGTELGRGNYGVVYKGKWRAIHVAVKTGLQVQQEVLADFVSEISVMNQMRPHPNVVQMYGIILDETTTAIVMEFLSGGSLDAIAFSRPLISIDTCHSMLLGIARGVLHIHKEKIIHSYRDLACRNILLQESNNTLIPKVSDFGFSRTVRSGEGKTKTTVGPVRWMAPESLKRIYSIASDTWMFGCVAYELLAGKEPHASHHDILTTLTKIRDEGYHPILPPRTPSWLASLLLECWSFDPDERPSFERIIKILDKYNTQAQTSLLETK